MRLALTLIPTLTLTLTLTLTRWRTARPPPSPCTPSTPRARSTLKPVDMAAALASGSTRRPPSPQPWASALPLLLGRGPSPFEATSQPSKGRPETGDLRPNPLTGTWAACSTAWPTSRRADPSRPARRRGRCWPSGSPPPSPCSCTSRGPPPRGWPRHASASRRPTQMGCHEKAPCWFSCPQPGVVRVARVA